MNSEKIEISGAGFRYFAHVGRGLIGQSGALTREIVPGHRAVIITDSNLPRPFLDKVAASFEAAEFQVSTLAVSAGEKAKSLPEVERICGELSAQPGPSLIVGLGGGVVGDLSGFVAAVFHRGIPHVQIPTTLLAMVDSAIGGKTGVNLATGKNLVGSIHHPSVVIADAELLRTLPARELRQGFAEIIKHAIVRDAAMFAQLSAFRGGASGDSARDDEPNVSSATQADSLSALIARNIRIKAAIISADDRDVSGARAVLNFGHTVGHGIECASDFQIPHGDCVSLGMVAACHVSMKRAGFPRRQCAEVISLLKRFDLPTQLPNGIAPRKIAEAIARDKKFRGREVRFVVTPRIGEGYLSSEVTMMDIEEAIAALSQHFSVHL